MSVTEAPADAGASGLPSEVMGKLAADVLDRLRRQHPDTYKLSTTDSGTPTGPPGLPCGPPSDDSGDDQRAGADEALQMIACFDPPNARAGNEIMMKGITIHVRPPTPTISLINAKGT